MLSCGLVATVTLSTKPAVNHAAAFCGLPFIYNPYIWWRQHIISHHQYTNDDELDVDLHHFAPAALSPETPVNDKFNEAWTFCWKGCLTTLGTSLLQPLRTLLDKPTPWSPARKSHFGRPAPSS